MAAATHCKNIDESVQNGCIDCVMNFNDDWIVDEYTITLSIVHGQLHLIKYFSQKGMQMPLFSLTGAVEYGHLNIVKYLVQDHHQVPSGHDYYVAVTHEHLHIINYFITSGFPLFINAYKGAIAMGHLYIIKYLRKKKFPWDDSVSDLAIQHGNLFILKYLHKHRCPIDPIAIGTAARFGYLDCFIYLREHGLEWCPSTVDFAELGNRLNILQYLHDNNYPYFEDRCGREAARCGHIELLKFLHEKGHRLSKDVCDQALWGAHYEVAVYLCGIGYLPKETVSTMARFAAEKNDINILRLLYESGACLDAKSIIYTAATRGHLYMLMYMKSLGYEFPENLELWPDIYRHINVLKYLFSIGFKFTELAINTATVYDKYAAVDYLLSVGCPYNRTIWCTNDVEHLVDLHSRKLRLCPDDKLILIYRYLNNLAFKSARETRPIPADIWNIIARMIV